MPSEFPTEVLDNAYSMLEHPDDQCEYNSLKVLDEGRYVLESYGHRGDVEPMDGFYSKDVDYTTLYTDLWLTRISQYFKYELYHLAH